MSFFINNNNNNNNNNSTNAINNSNNEDYVFSMTFTQNNSMDQPPLLSYSFGNNTTKSNHSSDSDSDSSFNDKIILNNFNYNLPEQDYTYNKSIKESQINNDELIFELDNEFMTSYNNSYSNNNNQSNLNNNNINTNINNNNFTDITFDNDVAQQNYKIWLNANL